MKRIAAFAAALVFYVCAHAQTFPAKPVRLIVSYPPGGGADLMARLVAPAMSQALGQPVIVENKAGASGRVRALGGEIAAYGPAQSGRFVREQTELWGRVVRAANVRID